MGHSYFAAKSAPPTEEAIRAALGPAEPLWRDLLATLQARYVCEGEKKYLYGKANGWAWRLRYKTKLLTNLYPAEGHLVAQVNLGPADVERAQALPLGESAREAIARARPYPEGRWVFVPVRSWADAEDVLGMLALRAAEERLPTRE